MNWKVPTAAAEILFCYWFGPTGDWPVLRPEERGFNFPLFAQQKKKKYFFDSLFFGVKSVLEKKEHGKRKDLNLNLFLFRRKKKKSEGNHCAEMSEISRGSLFSIIVSGRKRPRSNGFSWPRNPYLRNRRVPNTKWKRGGHAQPSDSPLPLFRWTST